MSRTPNEIPKNLYMEMLYFCRQYDGFMQLSKESVGHIGDIDLVRNAEVSARQIEAAADTAGGKAISGHLINNVCRDVKYEHLCNVPASRGTFTTMRKRFLYELAKMRHKI